MANLHSLDFEDITEKNQKEGGEMNRFEWSNHNEVLSFGQRSINESINGIDKYEAYGSVNALTNFREGVDIVLRLGGQYDKEVLLNRMCNKLEQMKKEKKEFVISGDNSAAGYLNGVRRDRAIMMIENYLKAQ